MAKKITFPILLNGDKVNSTRPVVFGNEGNQGIYELKLIRDTYWEGLRIQAIWHTLEGDIITLPENDILQVPIEATKIETKNKESWVTLLGTENIQCKVSARLYFNVNESGPISGCEGGVPSQNVVDQILDRLDSIPVPTAGDQNKFLKVDQLGNYELKEGLAEDIKATVPEGLPSETPDNVQGILDALNDKPSGTQSDWNINDSSNPAYVKNRPFYDTGEMEEVVIVPEFTGQFVQLEQLPIPGVVGNAENIFPIAVGEKYSIYWDGIKYNVEVKDFNGLLYLGNVGIIGIVDPRIVTDEPFFYTIIYGYLTAQTEPSHTIKATRLQKKIVTLPDQFISKNIKDSIKEKTGKSNAQNGEIYNDYVNNVASAFSHAEGYSNTASGEASHAEGWDTTASGNNSHAEGTYTTASGHYSHAEGYGTTASGEAQHVQGKYNIPDTDTGKPDGTPQNKYAHIVGNGNYDGPKPVYSNAHTLDWQGNTWYQGRVLVGGTDMDAPDAELTPTGVIVKSSTPGSVKRYRITVDDTGVIKAEEVK